MSSGSTGLGGLVVVGLLVVGAIALSGKSSEKPSGEEPSQLASSSDTPPGMAGKPDPQVQIPAPAVEPKSDVAPQPTQVDTQPPQPQDPPDPGSDSALKDAQVLLGDPFPTTTLPAEHEKSFGRGCSGYLTLTATRFHFECRPETPDATDDVRDTKIDLSRDQIQSFDKNGIVAMDGKKYHFTLSSNHGQSMSKQDAENLFENWFQQTK